MCLSTAYNGSMDPQNVLMTNVQNISVEAGKVVLTDLLERKLEVVGEVVSIDLVGGSVVLKQAN